MKKRNLHPKSRGSFLSKSQQPAWLCPVPVGFAPDGHEAGISPTQEVRRNWVQPPSRSCPAELRTGDASSSVSPSC